MRFEQPRRFNDLADGANGFIRDGTFKEILPFVAFCALTGLAVSAAVAFENWLDGKEGGPLLQRMLVAVVVLGASPLVVVPVIHQIYRLSKRVLELNDDLVRGSHHKPALNAPWKHIRQFEIEPINGRGDLARVSVTAVLGKKEILKRFSIVLNRGDQVPILLNELRARAPANNFTVVETNFPSELKRRPGRGLWPTMIGMFFFTIGFPLLAVGIADGSGRDRPVTRRPPVEVQRFVQKHFPSPAELRRAFIAAGSLTTAVGAGFYAWGWRRLDRHGRLVQADIRVALDRLRADPSNRLLIT